MNEHYELRSYDRVRPIVIFVIAIIHLIFILLMIRPFGNSKYAYPKEKPTVAFIVNFFPRANVKLIPLSPQHLPAVSDSKKYGKVRSTLRLEGNNPSHNIVPTKDRMEREHDALGSNDKQILSPQEDLSNYRPSTADILAEARRDMSRIEAESRNGPNVPLKLSTDSVRYKLENGISSSYVGDSLASVDFYTSPDGVVYMRSTKNGKTTCTMNGGPMSLREASGLVSNKSVNCPPKSSTWKENP